MNVSVPDVDLQLMFCCRLFVVQSFSLLSVGGKKNNKICGFLKKCWRKKLFEKKDVFFNWCSYTLCIQTIMNTNKGNVSARFLYTTQSHKGPLSFIISSPVINKDSMIYNFKIHLKNTNINSND